MPWTSRFEGLNREQSRFFAQRELGGEVVSQSSEGTGTFSEEGGGRSGPGQLPDTGRRNCPTSKRYDGKKRPAAGRKGGLSTRKKRRGRPKE